MRFLVLTGDGASDFRLTTSADAQEATRAAGQRACRISPIFPVVRGSHIGDPLKGHRFVGFFCPIRPFEFIGRQPASRQRLLWFTHGLPAVVRFAKSREELLEVICGQEAQVAAYEFWQVSKGKIKVVGRWVRSTPQPNCQLADFSELSKDGQRLLEEIQVNLHEASRCAAIYMPEQIVKLERVVASVNEIVVELRAFESGGAETTPIATPDVGEGRDAGAHQKINQRLSHLIQLNSALAYVVSQTSNGSVPILERPCLIATYSLLGVGTAYRAVSAVAGYVENVFERNAILRVIDEIYREVPGIRVPLSVPHYNLDDLRQSGLSIDKFLKEVPEVSRPKLAFFSLRLGFGEAHFSVTAAAQVLHAADSVRWSIMTLTHELLHSHVTGLLSTIFCEGVTEGLTLDRFEAYHGQFKSYLRRAGTTPPSTLDGLRYMIFVFAAWRHNAYEQARTLGVGASAAPNLMTLKGRIPESLDLFRSFYAHSLRLLEELVVHTLDVRYFYRGDRDLFLELLWESWTTVPAVVGDLETYLLRSLVAVASLEEGRVPERFTLARERLLAKLGELVIRKPENVFLRKAAQHLESKNNSRRLRLLFYPAIYIADMAATFLYSQRVEGKLWSDDPNIEPGERPLPDYVLEFGAFSGGRVVNPIPFLASRVRDISGSTDADEDFRSAWLLLATASAAAEVN